jgi:hypothetical protein
MNQMRRVHELKPHPDHAEVYTDGPDPDLTESIRKWGVLTPLLITRDNVIISGFKRWWAAKNKLGLEELPVTFFASDDDLDIKEAMVHANKQRVKERGQIAREATYLIKVERERARRRMQAGKSPDGQAGGRGRAKQNPGANPPQGFEETGKTRDKVGKQLGLEGRVAEKAAAVDAAITDLRSKGMDAEADELLRIMNEKGFEAAYRAKEAAKAGRAAALLDEPDADEEEEGAGAEPATETPKKHRANGHARAVTMRVKVVLDIVVIVRPGDKTAAEREARRLIPPGLAKAIREVTPVP